MQGFYFVINSNAQYRKPERKSTSSNSTRFTVRYRLPINEIIEIRDSDTELHEAFMRDGRNKKPILIESRQLKYLEKIDKQKMEELNALENNIAMLDALHTFKNLKVKSMSPTKSRNGGKGKRKTRKMKR